MRVFGLVLVGLTLGACETSDDPAEGGFINGIAGLAGGGYDARIEEREQNLSAAEARQAELKAQLAGLQSQYSGLRLTLLQQRSDIAASGKPIPAAVQTRLNTALGTSPGGSSDQERISALQKAISDAKALSAELAQLSV